MSEPANSQKPTVRRAIIVVLACYWLGAFISTHIPLPDLGDFPDQSDKLAHFSIYAGLAYLLGLYLLSKRPLRLRHYSIVFGVAVIYAIIDELLQVPVHRDAEFLDGLADALGALTGLGLLAITQRVFLRRWNRAT